MEVDVACYQDECGSTAAERASYHGHTQCVQVLADCRERVNWKKKDNWDGTPLYWALRFRLVHSHWSRNVEAHL